jgi:pyruvate dehydrogenase complex dihydrolipoamide acetyltransferase long form
MTQEIKLPDLGEGIDSAEVVSVLVQDGDEIQTEQGILEIETDKATMEVPSPQAGTVAQVKVSAGDTIEPGQVVLTLESAGGEDSQEDSSSQKVSSQDQVSSESADTSEQEDQEQDDGQSSDGQEDPSQEAASKESASRAPSSGSQGQTVEIKMPEVGEGVESGQVVSVLVREGDEIEAEQGIAEIETDKATVEVPCDRAGTVREVRISSGDTVEIGQVMLILEVGDAAPAAKDKPSQEEPSAQNDGGDSEQQASGEKDDSQEESGERFRRQLTGDELADQQKVPVPRKSDRQGSVIPAGPATRRHARQLGVDLSLVEGSGPGGRIQKEDVDAAVRKMSQAMRQTPGKAPAGKAAKPSGTQKQAPATDQQDDHGPVRREKMTRIRQTIARRMSESRLGIPHVTNFDDVDVTDLEAFRQTHKNDFETKLTMMPFVVKAVANALLHHPVLNASVDMEAKEILYKQYVSLGIAVDTDRGLVVPVLRQADELSIAEIASGLAQLAGRVREGDFSLEDLRGSTFTLSNLGAIGGQYSTPVINAPESAILLLGRSRREPRVLPDGSIQARWILPLSLSYDHRVVDGADAARFLEEVKSYLNSPGKLLLTI